MIDTTVTAVVILAVTLAVACLSIPYAVSGVVLTNLAAVVSGFVP